MQFNRRQFLTGASSLLAGLGVLDSLETVLGTDSHTAIAQSSPKKLALLVGVNQYQNRANFPDLHGCLTDVELMHNLLVYRFGFNPQDIQILTDEAATRKAIEMTFQTHLIDQAKSSDVVVFHFSGFGQYLLPASASSNAKDQPLSQYGLLPHDAVMAVDQTVPSEPGINAILQETLYLLIQSLKTDRVVTLLDTGFHYPGTRLLDHSRVRSQPAGFLADVNTAEIELQDELLKRNKIKRSQITEQRLSTPPRGLVVTAAYLQQFGIEADWQGFSAGALTYALSQQVWHTAPNSSFAAQVSRSAEYLAQEFSLTQQPELEGQKKSTLTRDVMGLPTSLTGDGVITETDAKGKSGLVWLGGMIPALMKNDKTQSIMGVLSNKAGVTESLFRVNTRKGLEGNAQTVAGGIIATGDQVKERFRQIAKNQPIRLALSSKLNKVEKIDATSVFSGNGSTINVIPPSQSADVVLSKVERLVKTEVPVGETGEETPVPESTTKTFYCLCTLAGDVLPDTIGDRPEAVKNRSEAFEGAFDLLRWHQCLEQLINPNNSALSASAAMAPKSENSSKNILLAKSTTAAAKGLNTVPANTTPGQVLTVNGETRYQLTLSNSSPDPLYCYLFGFDAQPNALMIYRAETIMENDSERTVLKPFMIEPGKDLILPSETEEFGMSGPSGIGSLYLMMTRDRLPQLEKAIDQATKTASKGSQTKQIKISNPVILREALLKDLARLSQDTPDIDLFEDDKYWTLSLNSWAMMRFVYQVI